MAGAPLEETPALPEGRRDADPPETRAACAQHRTGRSASEADYLQSTLVLSTVAVTSPLALMVT
jgi:hypothetical protein